MIEKRYYSIGEIAAMLDVKPSLLRYWEKEFPHLKPPKNQHGKRTFTGKEIEAIKYIYFLVKEQGYTLEGAKKTIREKDAQAQKEFQAIHTLENAKALLTEIKEAL